MIKPKVLFLCTGNSCRTQMAEAFLRDLAGDDFDIRSGGHDAMSLDPDAVLAMREVGLDISGQKAKKIDPFLRERFSFVITLCDREAEPTCPIFPGAIWRLQWSIENPAGAQSHEEHRAAVRRVRDQIRERVVEFAAEHK